MYCKNKLEGAVIIITGASSGLGREIALQLSHRKTRLILAGRDQERLAQVQYQCSQNGSQVMLFQGDLTDPVVCKKLIASVMQAFNRIDYLILNAGINSHFQFSKLKDPSVFQKLMKTNLYANVYLTKQALMPLRKHSGRIVVISSLSGKFGLPSRSAYCASKFALNGFFQSLRTEQKISIMMVYPTSLDTPMRSHSIIKSQSESKDKRQDPKICAEAIIRGMELGLQQVYVPWKGWLGVVLQPLVPRLIRWKVTRAARL